jgi:hypothetical protein
MVVLDVAIVNDHQLATPQVRAVRANWLPRMYRGTTRGAGAIRPFVPLSPRTHGLELRCR